MDTEKLIGRHIVWCEVALIHWHRLQHSLDAYNRAYATTRFLEVFEERGQPEEWRETAQDYESDERLTSEYFWRLAADAQAFLNAAGQVWFTSKELGALVNDFPSASEGLREARNYEEHWFDTKEYIVQEVKKRVRGEWEPGMFLIGREDMLVGGVSLREAAHWIEVVRQCARSFVGSKDD